MTVRRARDQSPELLHKFMMLLIEEYRCGIVGFQRERLFCLGNLWDFPEIISILKGIPQLSIIICQHLSLFSSDS